MKTCTSCGIPKNAEEAFYLHKRRGVSRRGCYCKQCERSRGKLRREKLLARPRDVLQEKRCSVCKQVKKSESFHRKRYSESGLNSRCRECEKIAKKRQWDNGGQEKATAKRYGVSTDYLRGLREGQRALCAICEEPLNLKRHRERHVDHDHRTGKIRGLLCRGCNTGLGQFREKPDVLWKALQYLRKFSEETPPEPEAPLLRFNQELQAFAA